MPDKMTLHRGLSELKLIDSKIEKQIQEIDPVGIFQKDKLVNNFIKKEDFEAAAKSKFDSINSLIKRKQKIKSAIVLANAQTRLKIGEKEMSIADAITYKTLIVCKKKLIVALQAKLQSSLSVLNKNNELVQKNIQAILEATFGKENVKVASTDMDNVRKPYVEANEFHLLDPLEVTKKLESLQTEISNFESEVDSTLSEVNATTFITV
jgi:hypothetical protein